MFEPIIFSCTLSGEKHKILLVDWPRRLTVRELADELYGRFRKLSQQATIIIFRLSVDHQWNGEHIEQLEVLPISERLPNAFLHLLYSQHFKHHISPNFGIDKASPIECCPSNYIIDVLKRAEITFYVRQSNAILTAPVGISWRAPSGKYVKHFLRVGNIQSSRRVLDAVFFWLLPHMERVGAILAESWTISSIALNAGRLLERYIEGSDTKIRVNYLPLYHRAFAPDTLDVLDPINRCFSGQDRDVLILWSAVSSGKALGALKQSIEKYAQGPERARYVALFSLEPGCEIDALTEMFHWPEEDAYKTIGRGKAAMDIDPTTFFPMVVRERPVRHRRKHGLINKRFVDLYRAKKVISVHCDNFDVNGVNLAHHGIYINVEAMLGTSAFRRILKEKIHQICKEFELPPRAIITPAHAVGSERLAPLVQELVFQFFGLRPSIFSGGGYEQEPEPWWKQIGAMESASAVLVLDDVCVTGSQLTRFSRQFRNHGFSGRIAYLVCAARMESADAWENLRVDLKFRAGREPHVVECVENIVLPNLDSSSCPWCQEARLLASLLPIVRKNQYDDKIVRSMINRLVLLNRAPESGGLIDDVLWKLPHTRTLQMYRNSVFIKAGASEADVFAAVAGAAQQLRLDGGPEGLCQDYPNTAIIDHRDYLLDRFDPVIKGAILRAHSVSTIRSALSQRDANVAFDVALDSCGGIQRRMSVISFEYLLAAAMGKIPFPYFAEGRSIDESSAEIVDLFRLFQKLNFSL